MSLKNIQIRILVGKASKYKNQLLVVLILLVVAITGCEEQSSIGVEILPDGDLITVHSTVIKEDISSFTHNETLIRTDGASPSLLGSFTDSLFGNTTIDFATEFRLFEYPGFGSNPEADSINLYLYYRIIYGDSVTPQKFRVYELESSLDIDKEYYQDVDLKSMAYTKLLGEVEYIPRVKVDSISKDTFYQLITIPIDISLGEKLVNADSSQMVNNDVFLEFFKGLLIETELVSEQGGTILSLDAASSSNFQGSALVLYYDNDETEGASGDTSLIYPYIISNFSTRVNRIVHDYSKAPFYDNLNSETNQDSLIYIQATGGLKSRILIDDLSNWEDSVNIAINKAELIFQIDTTASEVHRFAPPKQMLFTVVNEDGNEFLPVDYVFNPSFYGGVIQQDYTYRFNITQHLQQIINGTADNYGFFLTPAQKNNQANRVVLKGSTSDTGIRLIITYSKYTLN